MKILVTGSIAYDLLLTYDGSFADAIDPLKLDQLSLAFVTPHFAKHHGGTGANIAWNLRLLNQSPLLVGTVGSDGGSYTSLLKERGIPIDHVESLGAYATSTALIATDSKERQITFYHPGADSQGTWPELSNEREDIAYSIVSPRDARLMLEAMQWCEGFAVPYVFDPGQQVLAFSEDELHRAIRGSKGVIANDYEWSLLSERTHLSISEFLSVAPFLVVTHADEGLTLYAPEGEKVLPACKAEKVVNPTGAGDGLRAGLLTGLAAKWPLPKAAQLGAALASFVVEQEGTLIDRVDLNEVLGRAEVTYGEPLPTLP